MQPKPQQQKKLLRKRALTLSSREDHRLTNLNLNKSTKKIVMIQMAQITRILAQPKTKIYNDQLHFNLSNNESIIRHF